MRRPVLTLVFLSCLTLFLGLGCPAISDSDEAFYAEAAREMVASGDWLTPHFNYSQRWQKPVLYYWLTAATYLVAGPDEWAARLWSALSGLGLVLLTWRAAREKNEMRRGPDEMRRGPLWSADSRWLAGAIVATCYGYFAMARLALPDLPLAFCVTLTIWAALDQRWLLAGFAAAVGFLLKGPVALVVPALVLVPIWWRERRRVAIDWRGVALAAIAFAVVGLPWYVAMTLEHGRAYLDSFFVGDNLERFATDRFNDPRPVWFYVPILIGGLMPWSAYLVVLPWRRLREVFRRTARFTDEEWRLLLWALVPLAFFTLSVGKQPRYILPVLPPVAILLARSIAAHVERAAASGEGAAASGSPGRRSAEREGGGRKALTAATWATAVLYIVIAVLLWRARPLFITAIPWVTVTCIGAIAACAAALGAQAISQRWRALPATMTLCAAALLLAVQFGALSGARPEPVEQMAELVRVHRTAGEPVAEYEVFVRNLVFYTRFRQEELFDEGLALDFLKSPHRVLLVVSAADLPRLTSLSGVTTRTLGQVRYLDTASVRLGTLLSPIPEQDIKTILLVTNR